MERMHSPGGPDPGEAGLVEPLGEVLTQLSKGGGAKGINIDDVSRQLEELTKKYPFQVPNSSPVSDKLVSLNLESLSSQAPLIGKWASQSSQHGYTVVLQVQVREWMVWRINGSAAC